MTSAAHLLADALGVAGVAVVAAGELRGWWHSRHPRLAKDRIEIGGVPIPPSLEPLHFLIAGSTGVGKSQAINGLLSTLRARGDRVIAVDAGGEAMSRWWRESDTILSPLDLRSVSWSPFAEMDSPADADRISKSMIPDAEGGDREWQLYSQGLVSAVLERLWASGAPAANNAALVHALTVAKSDEIEALVSGLPAQTLFDVGAAKMLSSTRGIIGSYLPPYRFLPSSAGKDAWSIRRWVAGGDGWLWLPYRDDQRSAVAPLVTAWIGEVVSALLSLPPSHTRRVWLLLDEAAALGRIQGLALGLTQGRKYGLRAVLGLQSVAQLRQSYGRDGAQVLLSCASSSLVLRSCDAETADQMSRLLGEHQIKRDHSSHGPTGSSTAEHISIERVVLPSEIQHLPDLTGYLALAGDYPIARVSIPIVLKDQVVAPFVPIPLGNRPTLSEIAKEISASGAVPAPGRAVPGATGSAGEEKNPGRPTPPPRLSVELVPRGCAGENLRSILSADDWQSLRKLVSLMSAGCCSVCGGVGPEWPVELHEIFEYQDDSHTQRLAGLTTLCPACHESTHLGHAAQRGRERQSLAHLAQANGWDMDRTRHYVSIEMQRVRERSGYTWALDLSWLSERFPNLHFSRSGQDVEDSEQRGTQP